jgi:ArsR family transcriptional regulator, arsenate/arsenite/antimonite-responsive transcriptional repressor
MRTFLIYVNISDKIVFMPKALPMVDISAPVCCAPVAAGPMSDDDALQIALRLKALADPARVKIMSFLFSSEAGEENGGDLAAALGLTESTVSHHLTQLRRAGLVESDRRGMNVYHRAHRDALAALCLVLDPNCCS